MIRHDLQTVVRYRFVVTAVVRLLGLWLTLTRPLQVIHQADVILWQTYVFPVNNVRSGLI